MTQVIRAGRPPGTRDTREKCLVAAEKAFADHGFSGASLKEISQAVGVSNAAIVHYFKSKKALYSAVLDRISENLHASLPELPEDSYSAESIADLFDYFLDWSLRNIEYSMILLRELMENRNRVNSVKKLHMTPIINSYSHFIDEGKEKGLLSDIDTRMFVFFMLGSITHFSVATPTIGRMLKSESDQETISRFKATMRANILATLETP